MHASLRWINTLLDPGDVSPDELDHILTAAGFPIEERRDLPGGDVFFDVEVTSNRGDCLSHLGLAREIAACGRTPRRLKPPRAEPPRTRGSVGDLLALENQEVALCPRFTAQVIRGVKVGPSPQWLRERLEAVGQRSINNVVDVTNWLTLGLGHPSHVFDLDRLAEGTLVIRRARAGEKLRTLDGVDRTLDERDLVVADGARAQSLAGVIGGEPTEVGEETTSVVLEVACWDPVIVREMSRRHNVRTDASHRFERIVDPRTLEQPAQLAAAMLVEVAGGELAGGMLDAGGARVERSRVPLRASHAARLLGYDISAKECAELLAPLEIDAEITGEGALTCEIPPFRPDLTREVDLVEEVGRVRGFDAVALMERIEVDVPRPQESERARREIATTLAGLGFDETVTFSFLSPEIAEPFCPPGLQLVNVDDERRGGEPTLRPSVLPSLLACRKVNQDGQAAVPGGVRLFEMAATFAQRAAGGEAAAPAETVERRTLALLMDVPGEGAKRSFADRQRSVRLLCGAIESLVRVVAGTEAKLVAVPLRPPLAAWDPAAYAELAIERDGDATPLEIGAFGQIGKAVQAQHDLSIPVVAAELDLDALLGLYPPVARVAPLPTFPSIERDLSVVVGEDVLWAQVASVVRRAELERLEGFDFVGSYRGKPIASGRKSVTLRLRFRDAQRTLRHEEVDPQVDMLVARLKGEVGADLRA